MELKEYFAVIRLRSKLFWGVWLAVSFLALVAFFSQSEKLEGILSINLSRSGSENIQHGNDEYDQYYRLEADDRFSNVLEKWLDDPNIINLIYADSKSALRKQSLGDFSRNFRAEKLAPGYLQISFAVNSDLQAKKISQAVQKHINQKISSLKGDGSDIWFEAVFSGPTISSRRFPLAMFLFGGFFGGLLLALFSVLTAHYWNEADKE